MLYYIRGNSFLIFFHYIHQGLHLIMKIRIDDTGIKSYLNHKKTFQNRHKRVVTRTSLVYLSCLGKITKIVPQKIPTL